MHGTMSLKLALPHELKISITSSYQIRGITQFLKHVTTMARACNETKIQVQFITTWNNEDN